MLKKNQIESAIQRMGKEHIVSILENEIFQQYANALFQLHLEQISTKYTQLDASPIIDGLISTEDKLKIQLLESGLSEEELSVSFYVQHYFFNWFQTQLNKN